MDHYIAGHGGWCARRADGITWRKLWRRQWYHQTCAGVYTDKVNADGHRYVFGSAIRRGYVGKRRPHLRGCSDIGWRSATSYGVAIIQRPPSNLPRRARSH